MGRNGTKKARNAATLRTPSHVAMKKDPLIISHNPGACKEEKMPEEITFAECPLCGGFGGHQDGCPNGRHHARKAVNEWDTETDAPNTPEA